MPEDKRYEAKPGGESAEAMPEGQKAGRMRPAALSMTVMVQKALAPIQSKVVEDSCNRYYSLW